LICFNDSNIVIDVRFNICAALVEVKLVFFGEKKKKTASLQISSGGTFEQCPIPQTRAVLKLRRYHGEQSFI